MTVSGGVVKRKCDQCGRQYAARSTSSRYCTDACRRLAYKARKAAAAVETTAVAVPLHTAVGNPGDDGGPGQTERAVRAALEAAERLDTWQSAIALTLAKRLDDTPGGPASAIASRLEGIMVVALAGTEAPDGLDEIGARRAAKLAAARAG